MHPVKSFFFFHCSSFKYYFSFGEWISLFSFKLQTLLPSLWSCWDCHGHFHSQLRVVCMFSSQQFFSVCFLEVLPGNYCFLNFIFLGSKLPFLFLFLNWILRKCQCVIWAFCHLGPKIPLFFLGMIESKLKSHFPWRHWKHSFQLLLLMKSSILIFF